MEQAKAIIAEMNSAVGAAVAPTQNVGFLRSSGRHELKGTPCTHSSDCHLLAQPV